DPNQVPFDLQEMVAALAPRAFFSNSPLHDSNFDVAGVRNAIAAVKPIYELLGATERLQVRYPDAGHEFPPAVRNEAYQFIDLMLEHTPMSDIQAELSRVPPHEPADALSTFSMLAGFRLEQVAAEPLVASPVAMAFDDLSRLYVVEMRDYSEQDKEHLGRVRLLEDTDGDGKFDKAAIFAERLSWPTAVTCYDGGIFVGAAPDIWYLKDTTGDGRADVQKVVFTGFARHNVQGLLNSFQWGLDNRIHGTASSNGGLITRPDMPGFKTVSVSGRDFSFDPRALDLRAESGGAQHGMTFDDWGRKFVCSNSDHIQMVMFEDRYLARNPHVAAPSSRVSIAADGPQAEVFRTSPLEPWRIVRTRLRVAGAATGPVEGGGRAGGYFTGATGTTIFRGDAWPAEFVGQSFTGDVGSNIVHRKLLEPKGVGFVASRADQQREFLASTDNWFRPAQFVCGPDGALYVIDVYREVIEHPLSLPPQIKPFLDLTSGRDRGRIYRVVPDGFKQQPLAKLRDESTAALVRRLESRNGWTRDTAARLLFERQDPSAGAQLEKLARGSKLPVARMHAMYALAGLDPRGRVAPAVLLDGLSDDSPRVREHAVRLAERVAGDDAALARKLCSLANDPDLRVRYQLAFTLGELTGPPRCEALASIARRDAGDPWVRLAVFSSLSQGAGDVFAQLVADKSWRATPAGRELLGAMATFIARQHRREELAALLTTLESLAADDAALATSIVRGLGEGLAKGPGAVRGQLAALGSARTEQIVANMLEAARTRAADNAAPQAERMDAIRTLALDDFAHSGEVAGSLISTTQPQDIQAAALQTLSKFPEAAVARSIVAAWPTMSPRLRAQATEAVFSRAAWISVFVEAAESGMVSLGDLEPARLDALEKYPDAAIRRRALPLVAKNRLGRRQDVVAAYRSALTAEGDRSRGRQVFQKVCAACHRLEGIGHEIGPSLASF
ncbi:MAG TPA: PVC-type heme-binding CxxCH protein, partial [Pirellulales bacterium]|nr:PVC-type heme-binding CxxCH protein [Pirellulales bacterium]